MWAQKEGTPNNMYKELTNKLMPSPVTGATSSITIWCKRLGKAPISVEQIILLPHRLFHVYIIVIGMCSTSRSWEVAIMKCNDFGKRCRGILTTTNIRFLHEGIIGPDVFLCFCMAMVLAHLVVVELGPKEWMHSRGGVFVLRPQMS